jgi:hypothetical protein
VVAGIAVALLVAFDLGPPLPFGDDWLYAWSVRQLGSGHGLRLFPEASATALVQVLWGTMMSLGRADPRVLRLSLVPFLGLSMFAIHRLCRELGGEPFWCALASAALVANPLFLGLATSFMSDGFYIALILAACVFGLRWVRDGTGRAATVVLATLAVAQRQHGAAIIPSIALVLGLYRHRRRPSGVDWGWVGVGLATALAVLAAPFVMGFASANMHAGSAALKGVEPGRVLGTLVYLPGVLGFGLLPFLAGMLSSGLAAPRGRWPLLLAAVAGCLIVAVSAGNILPGNYLTPAGLGPVTLPGPKPQLLSAAWTPLTGLSLLAFAALFLPRRWILAGWRPPPSAALVLVLAVSQLLPMVQVATFDRYYLPTLALVLPLAAAMLSRARVPRAAQAWSVAALLAGVAVYAGGEQDYQAWQSARDSAARSAYRATSPAGVYAGYEAYAVYYEIPRWDRTGTVPGPINNSTLPSFAGPSNPSLVLAFAPASDPRPGFRYNSLAPGKILVLPGNPASR